MMDDYDTFIKKRALEAGEATLGATPVEHAASSSLFDGLSALRSPCGHVAQYQQSNLQIMQKTYLKIVKGHAFISIICDGT